MEPLELTMKLRGNPETADAVYAGLPERQIQSTQMNDPYRILLLGDSVAFARTTHAQVFETSWPVLVKSQIPELDIWQRCRPASTAISIRNEFRLFADHMSSFNAVLFQVGVSDSCPRPYPYFVQQILLALGCERALRLLNRNFQHFLMLRSKPWVSPHHFNSILRSMVDAIVAANPATQIAFIRIADAGAAYQRKVRGVQDSITIFNEVLESIKSDYPRHVEVLNPYTGFESDSILLPDGHHLSALGHQRVAHEVVTYLRSLTT